MKRGGLRIRFRSDWLAQLKLLQVLKELRVEGSNVMIHVSKNVLKYALT